MWKADNPGIVKVDPSTGFATALSIGTTTIRVTDPITGASGKVDVTIVAGPALVSFSIAANSTVVPINGTLKLTAIGQYKDAAGNLHPGPLPSKVAWVGPAAPDPSSNFATIDANGVVTGVSKGSATFTAFSNESTLASAPKAVFSVTVVDAVATTTQPQPQLVSKLVAGSRSVTFIPASTDAAHTDNFSIYEFDPGVILPAAKCAAPDVLSTSTLLSIVTSSSSTATSYAPPPAPLPPYTFTMTQPLVAGSSLCISETTVAPAAAPAAGAAPAAAPTQVWSVPLIVTDPNDYGRVRTYFLAGVQVSNQQTAAASSTAGQYIEAGFNLTWLRAKDSSDSSYKYVPRTLDIKRKYPLCSETNDKSGTAASGKNGTVTTDQTASTTELTCPHRRAMGISTNMDVRLSPIPVAAPATNTTTTTTTTTPASGSTPASTMATISTTPNLLSSQQSARVVTSLYFPWKATHWNKRSDYFTIAPLFRGGFATLLNTSLTSPASTTTPSNTTTTTVTGQFNSAYSLFAYGARFGWDRYPVSTDEAPQTMTQFLITMGYYSNLPSYVCRPAPAGAMVTANPNSACGATNTAFPGLKIDPVMSRMVIPRLDIEGFAKLPNYPFVIGIDANLAQYTVYHDKKSHPVDNLNKAGNDIRIFIGFQIPLDSLISKLGVTPP